MAKKTDARIIKTKDKLYIAFLNMLKETLFEEITVNEICERAGIRRATFYKHFNDKYSFLATMTEDLIGMFDAEMQTSEYKNYPIEYHIEYLHRLVDFLVYQKDVITLMFKSNMVPKLIATIVEINYKIISERLKMSIANGERLIANVHTVAGMLAGGIGTLIVAWLGDGMKTPRDEFVDEIKKMVYAVFVR